jgi:PNKP adenylyltransferase domain, ligase domain
MLDDIKKIKTRIDWMCENKVNAFSPTISPAFKNKERNEIESILEAVKYYVRHGVQEFIFQKKYMGSYCDIYLHKNITDTYLVSRNGYKISYINEEMAIAALQNLHGTLDWTNLEIVIIQSELLPWSTLGKGLIENEFKGYLQVHQTHYQYLQDNVLYNKMSAVKNSDAFKNFVADKNNLDAKLFKEKYPGHVTRQYVAILNFNVLEMDTYKNGIDTYAKQITHFGQDSDLYFKPFNILKKIFTDGTEHIVNDNFSYAQINDDEYKTIIIDITMELETQLQPIYDWYNSLCNAMEEGIMVKPKATFTRGLPPAFKIRNNNYLTMIYGVDFIKNYEENIGKRNIKRKLECSISDWMNNWELLKTKYTAINKENYAYKNILLDRILGEQTASHLDHRL